MVAKTRKKRIVLLDAHAIIHRAYHALPDFVSSKGEPTGALYGVCTMLLRIGAELRPDYMIAAYDLPKPTFRHVAYKEYKAGRQKADDGLVTQLTTSRDIFESFSVPIFEHPGFEADDIIGTFVELLKKEKDLEIVIASGDMDTMQLIDADRVRVYTLKKGINDTIMYDEQAVIDRFGFMPLQIPDYKGLAGDNSDNIIGIKGIGPKTATTIITECGSIEGLYKKIKKEKDEFSLPGVTPRIKALLVEGQEDALFSKTLATIRRDAPVTFKLPKEEWIDTVSEARVLETLVRFEFRSLKERVKILKDIYAGKEVPRNALNKSTEAKTKSTTSESEETLDRERV